MAVAQIGHLAGEELDVGAADTDTVHVDDDLAGFGDRHRDPLDATPARAVQDERPHRIRAHDALTPPG
ncbi:hypothetical protein GCM10009780_01940 [Actinomadura alba]